MTPFFLIGDKLNYLTLRRSQLNFIYLILMILSLSVNNFVFPFYSCLSKKFNEHCRYFINCNFLGWRVHKRRCLCYKIYRIYVAQSSRLSLDVNNFVLWQAHKRGRLCYSTECRVVLVIDLRKQRC